jgi:hypothetical protein
MLKQILILVALSIAMIFAMSYAQQAIQLLVNAHDRVAQLLTDVFSAGQAGNLARNLISLLAIPVILGLIPTLIYWIVRRNWFPYFMEIVWVVWLVQIGALIMIAR